VVAQVIGFLLGGYETTANALAFLIYYLSTHPEAQTKLQQEVDDVLGGRAATLEDIPKVKHLAQHACSIGWVRAAGDVRWAEQPACGNPSHRDRSNCCVLTCAEAGHQPGPAVTLPPSTHSAECHILWQYVATNGCNAIVHVAPSQLAFMAWLTIAHSRAMLCDRSWCTRTPASKQVMSSIRAALTTHHSQVTVYDRSWCTWTPASRRRCASAAPL
jgi:hypothetical protein